MKEYESLYLLEENNDSIEIEVGKFTVNDNDNIIVKFDMNNIKPAELKVIVDNIKKEYPNNKIIAIPDFMTVSVFNKSNTIKYLQEVIELLN